MKVELTHIRQLCQTHIDDSLRLQSIKAKTLLQIKLSLSRRLARPDDMHHLVDIVARDDEPLQDMRTLLSLTLIILSTTDHHLMTMLYKISNTITQRKQTRTPLDQSNSIHAKTRLQLSHLEQLIQDHTRISVTLHIDYDTHTLTVRLIISVAHPIKFALLDQISDTLDKLRLVHAIRNLRNDNLIMSITSLDISLGTHDDTSAPRLISILDTLQAHDISPRREVRSLDIIHQGDTIHLRIVHESHASINHLPKIMSRNIRCHTHSDTRSPVDQEIRNTRRHHRRLSQRIVKIVSHIDSLLFQVLHHSLTHKTESRLRITHRSSPIAINRSEVALTINQSITHSPILSHTHQRAIYRAIAMRVIFTQHLTHDTRTLLVRLIVRIAQTLHTEENTPMHRLEAITHIRQGTRHDDTH